MASRGGLMDSGEFSEIRKPERKPVLVILHQEHSTPGHVGRLLALRGHALDIRRPRYGDDLPATLRDHAAAVIFGGPMSANDSDDFVRREIGLVELALREEAAFLGICLGAQMMAAALGARVAADPEGHCEIGYHPVEPLPAATAGGKWPTRFYQWHSEGFDLPSGAQALATAAGRFPNQAISYGRSAFGLQFHPEITYAMAARWSARNEMKNEGRPGAQPRLVQLSDHVAHGPAVLGWLSRFLEDWLSASQGEQAPPDRKKTVLGR